MPHSSEVTWANFSRKVEVLSDDVLTTIERAENVYQDMLEVFQFAGGTDQLFADLLFDGIAPTADLEKAQDLKAAMVSIHDLFQAMQGTTITANDIAADLRRMS